MQDFLGWSSAVIAVLSIIGMIVGCFSATGMTLLISAAVYALNGIFLAILARGQESKESFWSPKVENEKKEKVVDRTCFIPISILWGVGLLCVLLYDFILAPLWKSGWSEGPKVRFARWAIKSKFRLGAMKSCNPDEQKIKHHLGQLRKILSDLEFQLRVYDDKTLPDAATMTVHFKREVKETQQAIEKLERELAAIAEETAQRATESVKPKGLLASADHLQAQSVELVSDVVRKRDARRDLEVEAATLKVQS